MKNYKPSMSDILTYVTRYKSGELLYELYRDVSQDEYTFSCYGKHRATTRLKISSLDVLDTEGLVKKMEQFVESNEAVFHSPLWKALE